MDLGAGTGRTYKYFNEKGYDYVALDFSKQMKDLAYEIHGSFYYILNDMVNLRHLFSDGSVDAIFAAYSLFHLPSDEFRKLLSGVYDILKVNGIFLFTYRIGRAKKWLMNLI